MLLLAATFAAATALAGASPSPATGATTLGGEAVAADADAGYLAALLSAARIHSLHETRTWRVLGHYKGRDVGRWMSQADGTRFFLSPTGKHDPEAELRATIRGLFAPPVALAAGEAAGDAAEEEAEPRWEDQHPQCRFPARTRWLREVLDIDDARLPRRDCPELADWKRRLAPAAVTLVFADAYMGNPASMFGHTFLRLDKADGKDLLANTVNFAADPWSTNPLIYPVAGIVGGFPGWYATMPYYLKVREYNALENRDLWEYPLELSAAEIGALLDHLWEVGPTPFRYHYFDENCSYQLLALLEGMDPRLRLTDRYTAWVFPTSTLRTMVEHTDVVGPPRFRHSRYAELVARRDALTAEERPLAHALAALDPETDAALLAEVRDLPPERSAAVLDAAYELHRYRAGDQPQDLDRARDQALLVARGALSVPSPPVEVERPAAPHTGHRPGAAAVGAYTGPDQGSGLRLRVRPAIHDLLSPQRAYVPGSMLEMMHVAVRVPVDPDADTAVGPPVLERFTLFRAASLARRETWLPRMAWRLETGWHTRRDALAAGDCGTPDIPRRRCLATELVGGPGLAAGSETLTAYGFVEGEAAVGPGVGGALRLGPGAAAGLLWAPVDDLRLWAEGRATYGAWSASGLLPGAEGLRWHADAAGSVHLSRQVELRARLETGGRGDAAPILEGSGELWWAF